MTHEIVTPGFTRLDERGEFMEVLNAGEWRCVITGHMVANAVLGNHYHNRVRVFFFLQSGEVEIRTVHVKTSTRGYLKLTQKQGVFLEPGESHVIRFLSPSEFLMLKSERYDPSDPDTIHFPVET